MKFLFVGGSQRSGTTVLQKFLCMDSQTTPKLAEASYLRLLLQAYQQGKYDFEHDTGSYFVTPEDFRHFHAGLIYSFLQRTLAQYPSARTLVLKEPHLTQLFIELAELVPDSKLILIMRDPRDILASMIDVGLRMKKLGQSHFFQQRNIEQLSQHIKSFYAPTLNNTDPTFKARYLVIRYEDLIQHSADIKQRISAFSGLALDFDETDGIGDDPDIENDQPRYQPWITKNNDQPINDSSIGRYTQVLSDQEIDQANVFCKDLIELFQYT